MLKNFRGFLHILHSNLNSNWECEKYLKFTVFKQFIAWGGGYKI